MMKKLFFFTVFCFASIFSFAQKEKKIKGMYIQWGYNKEWFTRSNIRFKLSTGDDFTLVMAKAHDKPDLDAVYKNPVEISIPQYNYRLGFYLNKTHTKAIELNFDHIKYVVTDYQNVKIRGRINGTEVNKDTILDPDKFLHFEHTDGGNLLHINYVQQKTLRMNAAGTRPMVNLIWKLGAGINIPRSDFTYKGDRYNNDFHIAGYNLNAEAGARFYFSKRWFLEGTGKLAYVRYINALANTNALKGNRVIHAFGMLEFIGLVGYDINF
jgi:hypothetical protein